MPVFYLLISLFLLGKNNVKRKLFFMHFKLEQNLWFSMLTNLQSSP